MIELRIKPCPFLCLSALTLIVPRLPALVIIALTEQLLSKIGISVLHSVSRMQKLALVRSI